MLQKRVVCDCRFRLRGLVPLVFVLACETGTLSGSPYEDEHIQHRSDAHLDSPRQDAAQDASLSTGDGAALHDSAKGSTDAALDASADASLPGTVVDNRRFDLSKPSYDLFRHKPLHSQRVMQSITFDIENHRLFIAQLQNGTSGDDLCINQVSLSGKLLGHMHHNAAGHGVSIAAEPVGKDTYLWVEADSHKTSTDGRGTALMRFKFESGKTPKGPKFLVGSRTITAAVDPVHRRLAVRRNEGGMHLTIYDLDDAGQGDFSQPIARFRQPPLSDTSVVFQGYTLYGDYLYTLDGTAQSNAANINSHITAINIHTGKVVARALTKAGKSLVHREPEGMGIYRSKAGEVGLYFGFASRSSAPRHANIFYKNVLIE